MTQPSFPIVHAKNDWLWSQIDVEYPTPESVQGRALYQSMVAQRQTQLLSAPMPRSECNLDEIYVADFHRMTVMFALLQASQRSQQAEQQVLVEFFTQIIFSPPCELYLGFADSEPVAAAILTCVDDEVLVSDIVVSNPKPFGDPTQFAAAVYQKWQQGRAFSPPVYLEL